MAWAFKLEGFGRIPEEVEECVTKYLEENICVILNKIHVVLRQIKPRILELRKGQSNLSIVFIFLACEKKNYNRFTPIGWFGFFDCR